jgi:hypothetical protein
MASTTTQAPLLIVCPHCGHGLSGSGGILECGTCHVAWPLPSGSTAIPSQHHLTGAHAA